MAKTMKVSADTIRGAFTSGQHLLVGTWEAAEIIGVERPRIGRWLHDWRDWENGDKEWRESGGKRGVAPHTGPEPETKMPKPLFDMKMGPVWLRSDIEEFARGRQQRAAA